MICGGCAPVWWRKDFILAALTAHLGEITPPGFVAAALDSAAATASRMSPEHERQDVLPLALAHIAQIRGDFEVVPPASPRPHH